MLCFASLLAGSMREEEGGGGRRGDEATKEWFGLEWTASLLGAAVGVAAFLPLLSFPSRSYCPGPLLAFTIFFFVCAGLICFTS
jgi:hypothetical protein